MANWSNSIITDKGRALEGKVHKGLCKFQYTKMRIGNGNGPYTSKLTDLTSGVMDVPISGVDYVTDHTEIHGEINNSTINSAFYMTELGLYAQDPDDGEILFMLMTDTSPDLMVDKNAKSVVSTDFTFIHVVSDAASVKLDIVPHGMARMDDVTRELNRHNADPGAHGALKGAVDSVAQALKTHREATTLDHPDGAVKSNHIAPGAVERKHIAPGAVGSKELEADSITADHVKDNSLPATKIKVRFPQVYEDSIDFTGVGSRDMAQKYGYFIARYSGDLKGNSAPCQWGWMFGGYGSTEASQLYLGYGNGTTTKGLYYRCGSNNNPIDREPWHKVASEDWAQKNYVSKTETDDQTIKSKLIVEGQLHSNFGISTSEKIWVATEKIIPNSTTVVNSQWVESQVPNIIDEVLKGHPGQDGWKPIGGGYFLQWGYAHETAQGRPQPFPIAFPNKCLGVWPVQSTPSGYSVWAYPADKASFYMGAGGDWTAFYDLYWFALGY